MLPSPSLRSPIGLATWRSREGYGYGSNELNSYVTEGHGTGILLGHSPLGLLHSHSLVAQGAPTG